MRRYTDAEKRFFTEYVYGHSYKEIQEEFILRFARDISLGQIKSYIHNQKMTTGRTGLFDKGHIPVNKGKPGATIGGMSITQFKKGRVPQNHKPVGTESIRAHHKRGIQYRWVKVAEPNEWRMKHVVIWEQRYGPVEKGLIVIFLDGNTLNCHIDNLACVDRNTHARMNQKGLRFPDAECTKAAIGVARLINQIAKAERGQKRGGTDGGDQN